MGIGASKTAPEINPQFSLGSAPKDLRFLGCGRDSAMILTDSNVVEIRNFDGTTTVKSMNMHPNCCCPTSKRGWIIGFSNGHLSEFDESLELVMSFRLPGSYSAHNAAIVQVFENADKVGKCRIVSVAEDNSINLWDWNGNHLFFYTSKNQIMSVSASPFFCFAADDRNHLNVLSVEELSSSSFTLPSQVRSLAAVGDGFAALAVLENTSVCLVSGSKIIESYQFLNNPNPAKILPLVLEEGTGLITYAVLDKNKKLTLRALEHVTADLGMVSPLYACSDLYIVTLKQNQVVVYSRDDLEAISVHVLNQIEIDLPRSNITQFFLRDRY